MQAAVPVKKLPPLEELPMPRPLAQAAQRLLGACESPSAKASEVARIIECDPAISLRLLRMANSSLYGFSTEIRNVNHAVVALGMREVRNLAVAISAASAFRGDGNPQGASTELWQHSLACASTAAQLAHLTKVAVGDAFLGGLVHDVGKLVLLDVAADDYAAAMSRETERPTVDIEDEHFGITHQEIGTRCADEWGLPGEVNVAISKHHVPELADDAMGLAGIVCVANTLCRRWSIGDARIVTDRSLLESLERSQLPFTLDQLDGLRERAVAQFRSLKAVCE